MDSEIDLDLVLLLQDALVFRSMVADSDPLRAIVLAPYLSTFAVESFSWLRNRKKATGSFGSHSRDLEAARHSLKFLDDTIGAERVVQRLRRTGVASHHAFSRDHKGVLGPLKRWLQPDLALFVSADRVIGSSHSALVQAVGEQGQNASSIHEMSAVGPGLRAKASELGRYLTELLTKAGIERPAGSNPLPVVEGRDVRIRCLSPVFRIEPARAMVTSDVEDAGRVGGAG
ncbi:MAG: hypothetical protein U0235_01055 [Polyangiaceae bacterium]